MEGGNNGSILPPPAAVSPHHPTAGAPPPSKGDGVCAQAVVRQMGFKVLPQPVVAATVGPYSAPQSGFCGPVNQVGGDLSNGIPLRIIDERIKQLKRTPESDCDAQTWLKEQINALLGHLQDHGVSAEDHWADQLERQAVLSNVEQVLQSNASFLTSSPLYIKLHPFKEPSALTIEQDDGSICFCNGDSLFLFKGNLHSTTQHEAMYPNALTLVVVAKGRPGGVPTITATVVEANKHHGRQDVCTRKAKPVMPLAITSIFNTLFPLDKVEAKRGIVGMSVKINLSPMASWKNAEGTVRCLTVQIGKNWAATSLSYQSVSATRNILRRLV
uniref:Uncharacterized protein n=1 Tax=Timema cristinae TaxID=61476 RepID=A0A7R9HAE7_TIMCR|nr:unnamed protein product [Timema cristinae]